MSNKRLLIIPSFVFLSVLFLARVYYFNDSQILLKSPQKPKQFISKTGIQALAQHFFQIKIENEIIAQFESDTTEFNLALWALRDIPDGLNYRWILPADIHILEGETGTLQTGPLRAGDKVEIPLRLNGFAASSLKYIKLEVSANLLGQNAQQSALLSSQKKNSLEFKIQKAEQKKQQANFKLGAQRIKSKFDLQNVIK